MRFLIFASSNVKTFTKCLSCEAQKLPRPTTPTGFPFCCCCSIFCPFFCCFHCYKLRLNFSSPHSKWCAVWLHPSRRQKETNKTAVGAQQRLFLFPFYYYHVGVLFCPIRFEFCSRAKWSLVAHARQEERDGHTYGGNGGGSFGTHQNEQQKWEE